MPIDKETHDLLESLDTLSEDERNQFIDQLKPDEIQKLAPAFEEWSASKSAVEAPKASVSLEGPVTVTKKKAPAPEKSTSTELLNAAQDYRKAGLERSLGIRDESPARTALTFANPLSIMDPTAYGSAALQLGAKALGHTTPVHVLAGRFHQGMDPFVGGSAGDEVFDKPELMDANDDLHRIKVGGLDVGALGEGFAQTAPDIVEFIAGMGGIKEVVKAGGPGVWRKLAKWGQNAARAGATTGTMSGLGAKEGERLEAVAVGAVMGAAVGTAITGVSEGIPAAAQLVSKAKNALSGVADDILARLVPHLGVPSVAAPKDAAAREYAAWRGDLFKKEIDRGLAGAEVKKLQLGGKKPEPMFMVKGKKPPHVHVGDVLPGYRPTLVEAPPGPVVPGGALDETVHAKTLMSDFVKDVPDWRTNPDVKDGVAVLSTSGDEVLIPLSKIRMGTDDPHALNIARRDFLAPAGSKPRTAADLNRQLVEDPYLDKGIYFAHKETGYGNADVPPVQGRLAAKNPVELNGEGLTGVGLMRRFWDKSVDTGVLPEDVDVHGARDAIIQLVKGEGGTDPANANKSLRQLIMPDVFPEHVRDMSVRDFLEHYFNVHLDDLYARHRVGGAVDTFEVGEAVLDQIGGRLAQAHGHDAVITRTSGAGIDEIVVLDPNAWVPDVRRKTPVLEPKPTIFSKTRHTVGGEPARNLEVTNAARPMAKLAADPAQVKPANLESVDPGIVPKHLKPVNNDVHPDPMVNDAAKVGLKLAVNDAIRQDPPKVPRAPDELTARMKVVDTDAPKLMASDHLDAGKNLPRLEELAPNAGQGVYVGRGKAGHTGQGIFLGADAENPGHVIVWLGPGEQPVLPEAERAARNAAKFLEKDRPNKIFTVPTARGKFVSLPTNEVFVDPKTRPIEIAADKLPVLPTRQDLQMLPDDLMAQIEASYGDFKNLARRIDPDNTGSVWKTVKKMFGVRNDDMHRLVMAIKGSRATRETSPQILNALTKRFPQKNLAGAATRDVESVALGRMSWADFKQKNPDVGDEFTQLSKALVDEIRSNSAQLEAMGYLQPGITEKRLSGDADQYLAQQYLAHLNPTSKYAQRAPQEDVNAALDFIVKEHDKAGQVITPSKAHALLLDLMNADDAMQVVRAYNAGNKKVFQRLMKKDVLPPELAKVLGPVAGLHRIAYTLGQQRAILQQANIFNEIYNARRPDPSGLGVNPYFSTGMRDDLTVKVPDDKKMYGPLAGGWLHPDFAPVIAAADAIDNGFRWSRVLSSFVKGNMVAKNPGSWVRNAMRNVVPLTIVNPDVEHMVRASDVLRSWKSKPIAFEGGVEHPLHEATRVGALQEGLAASEISEQSMRLTDEMVGAIKKGNGLAGAFAKFLQWNQRADTHLVEKFMDHNDRWVKMSMYLKLKETGLGEAARKGLVGSDANEFAARFAADHINMLMPNFDNIPKWADKLRRTPFGVVNPFLSSQAEELRVLAQLPRNAAVSPVIRQGLVRLALMTAGMGAALSAARQQMGVSDEDVKAFHDIQSRKGEWHRPGAFVLGKVGKQLVIADMTPIFMPLSMLAGDRTDPVMGRIAANSIASLLGPGMEPAIRMGLDKLGVARAPTGAPTLEGDRGTAMNAIEMAWGGGGLPGNAVLQNIRRVVSTENKTLKPGQEPVSRGYAAAKSIFPLAPPVTLPDAPGGSPTQTAAARELIGGMLEQKRQIPASALSDNPERNVDANINRINELVDDYNRQ